MENSFLSSSIKRFKYYKNLGDKAFEQLNYDELQKEFADDSNSISIIVKHLVGNMLSRWTNFLTEDGEKTWRNRDQEFEDTYTSKQELLDAWETGWNCLFKALESIKDGDLEKVIFIRNEEHTITEAIVRQLAHYPYHIGQIVFIGKLIKGKQWKSLSIPKGKSEDFNAKKFSKGKSRGHFTNDLQ
jgi:hypothetical protein